MALIWGVLTTGFWKTTCAVLTTAAKVARMPAKHCMQTHLDRHKDHTNYLFTVTMPPALTHEQCRHQICALCYCEHGRKADRSISKKEEKLLEDFIPQYLLHEQSPDASRLEVSQSLRQVGALIQ